jgi:hypothetical protein
VGGAKGDGVTKPSELFPDSLIWAIVSVFIVGLGIIIGLMAFMKEGLNLNVGIILAAASLIFLLMLAIEGVLIWLLMSRKRGAREVGDTERVKEQPTKELDAAQARALPEPVSSITEDTTRTFEPVPVERQSK